MVKRANYVLKNFFVVAAVVAVLLVSYGVAIHTINSSTNIGVNEDIGYIYNISINNTDAGQAQNISEINISLPASWVFLNDSNGTDAVEAGVNHTFVRYDDQNLSWFGSALVNGSTSGNFWFNATAPTPGVYNITVFMTNSSTTTVQNITVTVNDTTKPSAVEWESQTTTILANQSHTDFLIGNISLTDNFALGTVTMVLHNSSHGVVQSNVSVLSGTYQSFYVNFSVGLAEGTYYLNTTINDTYNNNNLSQTRVYTLDTTKPLISLGNGVEVEGANKTINNVWANVTVTETNELNITFELWNSTALVNSSTFGTAVRAINWTSLADERYYFNVTVQDSATNRNTTVTRTFLIDSAVPTIALTKANSTATTITVDVAITESGSGIAQTCVPGGTATTAYGAGTSQIVVETGLTCATTYEYTVNCNDSAGNVGTKTESFATSACGSSSGSAGGGSGGSATTTTWTNTYTHDDQPLSELGTVTRELGSKERIRVSVGGEDHTVGVLEVGTDSVKVEVASTPQQTTVKVGETVKFDVDGDNVYDLSVMLNSISSGKADISVNAISEAVTQQEEEKKDTSGAGAATEEAGVSWAVWAIVIAVVAVLLIVWAVMKKRK
jgi:hypothetical protein